MKRIYISLIALLFSFVAFAQPPAASALRVENRSNCTQYYIIFGDKPCICGSAFNSQIFAIPPGAVQNFASTTLLGGSFPTGSPAGIVGARIYHGPISCMPPFGIVGQTPCGFLLSYAYLVMTFNGTSCVTCSTSTANWTMPTTCADRAILVFTP